MAERAVYKPTADYMTYAHSLHDDDVSDYRYLQKIFCTLFHRHGFEHDKVIDWTVQEFRRLEVEVLPLSIEQGCLVTVVH
jgi:hypothetical protein